MIDLCQVAELNSAVQSLNDCLASSPISNGCRIELGLQLIRGALGVFTTEMCDEIIAYVLKTTFEMRRASPPAPAPAPAPVVLAEAPVAPGLSKDEVHAPPLRSSIRVVMINEQADRIVPFRAAPF